MSCKRYREEHLSVNYEILFNLQLILIDSVICSGEELNPLYERLKKITHVNYPFTV